MFSQTTQTSAGGLLSSPAPQEPSRQPEMTKAMEYQSSALIDLESAVSQLYQRLEHVVRQEPENASEAEGKLNPSVPRLITALNQNTQRVQSMAYAINRLINKLEI